MTDLLGLRVIQRPRFLSIGVLAVSLLGSTAAHAGGMAPDLDQQVQQSPNSGNKVRVIVQLTGAGADTSALAKRYGGDKLGDQSLINGAVLYIPKGQLKKLQNDPNVSWISPDRQVQSSAWDCDTQAVAADQVWSTYGDRGTGIGVAVLDTGVNPANTDLNPLGVTGANTRITGWKDLLANKPQPYDDNGHGSHVSGIAMGSGNLSGKLFTGTAPNANLISVKVLDNTGSGSVSNIINGLNWCVANKSTYNIRVINLSLGHKPAESYKTDPLCAAVRSAVHNGIIVVVAAGNCGKDSLGNIVYGGISSPGNEPSAITVGASNTQGTPGLADDTVCTFSSRGPTAIDQIAKPDLVAPGNKIVSMRVANSYLDTNYKTNQVPTTSYGFSGAPWYFILSGTSMAAPQVAGVAALVVAANPTLTPNAVKAILMYTAIPLQLRDAQGLPLSAGLSTLTQGAGCVNALGAVETASKINAGAAAGSYWLTGSLSKLTTIAGVNYTWGQTVKWGDRLLTGDSLVTMKQVVWSDATVGANQVVWSDQCVWNDDSTSDPSSLFTAGTTIAVPTVVGMDSAWACQVVWSDQCVWSDTYLGTMAYVSSLIAGDAYIP